MSTRLFPSSLDGSANGVEDIFHTKFVQNVKLALFERFYSIDSRCKLYAARTSESNWFDDYCAKRQAKTVANIAQYLSLFAPRFLPKSHEQCVLFMHFFINSKRYASNCADNIFVFLFDNKLQVDNSLQTPPIVDVDNLLVATAPAFEIDPLAILFLSPSFFPLARFYLQFTGSGSGLAADQAELCLIEFFDANKSALAKLHMSMGVGSSIGAVLNSVDFNRFLAYFFYFIQVQQGPATLASRRIRLMIQNLLKVRSSACQLLLAGLTLPERKDYWAVPWAQLDPAFFSPDAFVHFLFPSMSATRQRITDYIMPPNDTIKNISVFNGLLVSTSTSSNLKEDKFAGWHTYFALPDGSRLPIILSESVYFNRTCRPQDFWVFVNPVSRKSMLLTTKLNIALERVIVSDEAAPSSLRLFIFIRFITDTCPPITNRRILHFSLPDGQAQSTDLIIHVIDVADNSPLLKTSAPNVYFLDFINQLDGAAGDSSTAGTEEKLSLHGSPSPNEFWASYTYDMSSRVQELPAPVVTGKFNRAVVKERVRLLDWSGAWPQPYDSRVLFSAAQVPTNLTYGRLEADFGPGFKTGTWGLPPDASITAVISKSGQNRATWPDFRTPGGRASGLQFPWPDFDASIRIESLLQFSDDDALSRASNPYCVTVLSSGACANILIKHTAVSLPPAGQRMFLLEILFSVLDGTRDIVRDAVIATNSSLAFMLDVREVPLAAHKSFAVSAAIKEPDINDNQESCMCALLDANRNFLMQIEFFQ